MVVARRIETEKRLQQPMEAGGPEQVAPPDHVGHFLARIIVTQLKRKNPPPIPAEADEHEDVELERAAGVGAPEPSPAE